MNKKSFPNKIYKIILCLLLHCSPDVVFCGYSVPHPSENKINLRIQTNGKLTQD